MLKNINSSLLVNSAIGVFVGGTSILYFFHQHMQRKVQNFPHYKEVFNIVGEHEDAKCLIGTPIEVGNIDLTNRKCNYIGDLESKLRIPISGKLNCGFLNVYARRESVDNEFSTQSIELELENSDDAFLIYEKRELPAPAEKEGAKESREESFFARLYHYVVGKPKEV